VAQAQQEEREEIRKMSENVSNVNNVNLKNENENENANQNQNEEIVTEEENTEEVEIIEKDEDEAYKEFEESKESEEFKALHDKYIRLYAEYENFRKRTAKEKDEIYSNAAADVLKNIFPVLDSFERALQFSGDAIDAIEPEKVLEGLKMIESQFLNALTKIGVEEIKAEGEQFNPEMHNAVFHETDESKPDNTVTEVLQKGYIKGDKVLREAMVKVVN
jgi:molecular chaperone GrpE